MLKWQFIRSGAAKRALHIIANVTICFINSICNDISFYCVIEQVWCVWNTFGGNNAHGLEVKNLRLLGQIFWKWKWREERPCARSQEPVLRTAAGVYTHAKDTQYVCVGTVYSLIKLHLKTNNQSLSPAQQHVNSVHETNCVFALSITLTKVPCLDKVIMKLWFVHRSSKLNMDPNPWWKAGQPWIISLNCVMLWYMLVSFYLVFRWCWERG